MIHDPNSLSINSGRGSELKDVAASTSEGAITGHPLLLGDSETLPVDPLGRETS
jgi:hypothetical protein